MTQYVFDLKILRTLGYFEKTLGRLVGSLYRNNLGKYPQKITCQVIDNKLVIILEDFISNPAGDFNKEQVREIFNSVIRPEIQQLVEEFFQVKVLVYLNDFCLENKVEAIVLILSSSPIFFQKNTSAL